MFDGDIVTVEEDRYGYGEQRFVTFGLLPGRVILNPLSNAQKTGFSEKPVFYSCTHAKRRINNQFLITGFSITPSLGFIFLAQLLKLMIDLEVKFELWLVFIWQRSKRAFPPGHSALGNYQRRTKPGYTRGPSSTRTLREQLPQREET